MAEPTIRRIEHGEDPCWWCGSEYVLQFFYDSAMHWETQCSVCGVYHHHHESRGYQGYTGQGYTGRVVLDDPGLQGYTGYEGPVSMETRYITPTPAPENIELILEDRMGRTFAAAGALARFTDSLQAQMEMMERL